MECGAGQEQSQGLLAGDRRSRNLGPSEGKGFTPGLLSGMASAFSFLSV